MPEQDERCFVPRSSPEGLLTITADNAAAWFPHCGYEKDEEE